MSSVARPARALRLRPVAVFLMLVALAAAAVQAQPATKLTGLDGSSLEESDLLRGSVILVTWASWSPRCRNIVPRVNALAKRWAGEARIVTVNFQEKREVVDGFLAGQTLDAPVYLDEVGAFSKKHSITFLPGLLILREGVTAFNGRLDQDPNAVIDQALK